MIKPRLRFKNILLLYCLYFIISVSVIAQTTTPSQPLMVGAPSEYELSSGQSHLYGFSLALGQNLKILVEQRGIDTTITLVGPNEKLLERVENNRGNRGLEVLLWQAQFAGEYRLEVSAKYKPTARGSYRMRADILYAEGDHALAYRKFVEARELMAKRSPENMAQARRLLEETVKIWQSVGDQDLEAFAFSQLALLNFGTNQVLAIEYYKKSLALYQSLGFKAEEARLLNALGSIHVATMQLGEGRRFLEKAYLDIRELPPATTMRLLMSMGQLYSSLGEREKSKNFLQQAVNAAQILGDKAAQVNFLHSLGEIYLANRELAKALDTANTSLLIAQSLKDASFQESAFRLLGRIYREAGATEKALEFLQKSLAINLEESQNPINVRMEDSATLVRLSETYNDLGDVYQDNGDLETARTNYQRSIEVLKKKNKAANSEGKYDQLIGMIKLGELSARQKEYDTALNHLRPALNLCRELRLYDAEIRILYSLADIQEQIGEKAQSQLFINQSMALAREFKAHNIEAYQWRLMAKLSSRSADPSHAREWFEKSLDIFEKERLQFSLQPLKDSFTVGLQQYYEEYLEFLQSPAVADAARGLNIAERAKARGLLDLLAEAQAEIHQGADSALLLNQRNLQRQLNGKAAAYQRLVNDKNQLALAKEISQEIRSLSEQLEASTAQIRDVSPRYAALTLPQPLTTTEIQQQILDDDTLLLEFALGEKQSYLWVVSPQEIKSYQLPSRAEITTAARKVYDQWTQIPAGGAADKSSPGAQALSQMLLGAAASELGNKRLLIVAPEILAYVPFAALPTPVAGGR